VDGDRKGRRCGYNGWIRVGFAVGCGRRRGWSYRCDRGGGLGGEAVYFMEVERVWSNRGLSLDDLDDPRPGVFLALRRSCSHSHDM